MCFVMVTGVDEFKHLQRLVGPMSGFERSREERGADGRWENLSEFYYKEEQRQSGPEEMGSGVFLSFKNVFSFFFFFFFLDKRQNSLFSQSWNDPKAITK